MCFIISCSSFVTFWSTEILVIIEWIMFIWKISISLKEANEKCFMRVTTLFQRFAGETGILNFSRIIKMF